MSPTVIALIFFLVGIGGPVARENTPKKSKWRQIILMRSTRQDVEKLLGRSKNSGFLASYKVEDGTLDVEYYEFDFCTPAPAAYLRVPRGTVVEIIYVPDSGATLASLKLDLRKFRKVRESIHVPEAIGYRNDKEGVDYTFQGDETLDNIRYFPGSHFDRLRCR